MNAYAADSIAHAIVDNTTDAARQPITNAAADMAHVAPEGTPVAELMAQTGRAARSAEAILARADTAAKDAALGWAAAAIHKRCAAILEANAKDVAAAQAAGMSAAFIDRLTLTRPRIEAMAEGVAMIGQLSDPVGDVIATSHRPNGLKIERVRVPLGVIGIIYESRPNVTADAGALCLKSGNAVILRGGSDSQASSTIIADCLRDGLGKAALPESAIQIAPTSARAFVGAMLCAERWIDVIVPRGGRSLIARVLRESRVPVLAHLDGMNHVYLHESADPVMAREIVVNAKMRRTGVCGAVETLLVDRAAATTLLPPVLAALDAAGCAIRGCPATCALWPKAAPATDEDWDREYLDAILAVKLVDGVGEALDHIRRHGSKHTEAIVAADIAIAERFLAAVDAAIVLHNASTQFADGGEFGMGAEIGIATGKLHARGPVGVEQLTSFKYRVHGSGQTRP